MVIVAPRSSPLVPSPPRVGSMLKANPASWIGSQAAKMRNNGFPEIDD
jgi:hypothetical protein